jgi:hypothetical protein
MMAAIQLRHAKIWYAAKLKNWDLADYELRQLEANLNQALPLYPSKPASDADASYKAVVLISEFLKAKTMRNSCRPLRLDERLRATAAMRRQRCLSLL